MNKLENMGLSESGKFKNFIIVMTVMLLIHLPKILEKDRYKFFMFHSYYCPFPLCFFYAKHEVIEIIKRFYKLKGTSNWEIQILHTPLFKKDLV